jgi:DNA-binding transcriptional ArsR family regulator
MKEFMSIARALSDENRVRILMFLRHGELCVCQIIEMLGLAPSTVSKHLSILKQADLIDSKKKGRWVYYRMAHEPSSVVLGALEWVRDSLSSDRTINDDDQMLKRVMKTCLVDLCVHYSNGKREAA